ncbi:glycoside hydrolase family 26 protein [Streptomyces sp. NBC_00576]|uniref:glycoside hydrolase family 26 protein n=1 Tax=Streptomyces sp. NBC_00576 TaxID=2903665 RepID=UPI002E812F70|nr:glycosyl hydrolase [Streptomyces sp. NBC_00576]WUB73213.1 glycosyl hydrolase [Streptomyces sp. NBC_00576]
MSSVNGRRKKSQKKLHWWNRGSGIRLRVWMAVNAVLLGTLSYGVYAAVTSNAESDGYTGLGSDVSDPGLMNRLKGDNGATIPSKNQFLHPDGVYFGAATVKAPYDAKELAGFTTDSGGIQPTMASYFLTWGQKFNAYSITAAYSHGTLPVLTWEPWKGGVQNPPGGTILDTNTEQPQYRLSNIINGRFDSYITATAKSVAKARMPLVLRFAHEMNGAWYPWSEKVNGNHKGDYVKAWRHVHDLFEKAGATNVIWVWSPNIIRPVPGTKLKPLYPGDDYVDWVGMTGYGVHEKSPEITFGPTIKQVQGFTRKQIMIMETGAQIDDEQLSWVNAFFPWLKKNPDVIGFIWMQKDRDTGARANWRFTSSTAEQQAFQSGLADLDLATGESVGASSSASSSASSRGKP